ncbi:MULTISPECIES: mandelate racemase/muconate lactonizing enzyme family protein [unclassified Sphingomonas]|uniref:mandelate racemase/muconate lactonizing enzyme family protein n=1 Tax=unclassified Sphingomonas TaxID=196159 RepID=UPI00082CF6EB|nr:MULTISPECIES: mandelate racemase/muconate lactonizing enzyme family protein [unclassified Sphingomonas]
MTRATISRVEVFTVTIPRETPYLGAIGRDDRTTPNGYIVRAANGTLYPTSDRSVLVRITDDAGRAGWGETYGLVAPDVIHALVGDIVAPLLVGQAMPPPDRQWDAFYDLMRVRGYWGGFWADALAAVDIALWDLAARQADVPLHALLGTARRERVPAYVSGLPRPTRDERVALAQQFRDRGFNAVKIAAVMTPDAITEELGALRTALGSGARLMVDLHWMYDADEATRLLARLAPLGLLFAEAPVKPEDIDALVAVTAAAPMPIAVGEEWRTTWDAAPRLARKACDVVQPEMGHTGITQFLRIAAAAEAHGVPVIPHATIGTGIFLAASLHASMVIADLPLHEYQHSIFHRNAALLDGDLTCDAGFYCLPGGLGLGVAPASELFRHVERQTG